MSKFSQLLGRLEEQAIRIHDLQAEYAREREAATSRAHLAQQQIIALRQEVARLSQPRDPEGKKAHAYEELHRVILDAHSLFDDASLTDADRAKSIHGLIDQVLGRDWFANSPHRISDGARTRKKTAVASPDTDTTTPE
jgi:hypothetical protein